VTSEQYYIPIWEYVKRPFLEPDPEKFMERREVETGSYPPNALTTPTTQYTRITGHIVPAVGKLGCPRCKDQVLTESLPARRPMWTSRT
jgi:hypothetical protein